MKVYNWDKGSTRDSTCCARYGLSGCPWRHTGKSAEVVPLPLFLAAAVVYTRASAPHMGSSNIRASVGWRYGRTIIAGGILRGSSAGTQDGRLLALASTRLRHPTLRWCVLRASCKQQGATAKIETVEH